MSSAILQVLFLLRISEAISVYCCRKTVKTQQYCTFWKGETKEKNALKPWFKVKKKTSEGGRC